MKISNKDIENLSQQNTLESSIWDSNKLIKEDVRIVLLKLSYDFIEELRIPRGSLIDIRLTGSLASYSWSKYSDVDLHVILDLSKIPANLDLTEAYLKAKKSIWNNEKDVEIYGYEVEIYAESSTEDHKSNGLYSLLLNKWLKMPEKLSENSVDIAGVKIKTNNLIKIINDMVSEAKRNNNADELKNVIKKLKKFRQRGLEEGGEYSNENLVFKLLRRKKYIEKIITTQQQIYNDTMSVK